VGVLEEEKAAEMVEVKEVEKEADEEVVKVAVKVAAVKDL